jgi:hypothetical protein
MLLELLFLGTLLTSPGATTAMGSATPDLQVGSEHLATVRHFSRNQEPQWTFTLLRSEQEELSGTVWWIVDDPASTATTPPASREARHVEMGLADCGALAEVIDEFERLRRDWSSQTPVEEDEPDLLFTLETPDHPPIDLASLASDDPMVEWAIGTWERLAACVG